MRPNGLVSVLLLATVSRRQGSVAEDLQAAADHAEILLGIKLRKHQADALDGVQVYLAHGGMLWSPSEERRRPPPGCRRARSRGLAGTADDISRRGITMTMQPERYDRPRCAGNRTDADDDPSIARHEVRVGSCTEDRNAVQRAKCPRSGYSWLSPCTLTKPRRIASAANSPRLRTMNFLNSDCTWLLTVFHDVLRVAPISL